MKINEFFVRDETFISIEPVSNELTDIDDLIFGDEEYSVSNR